MDAGRASRAHPSRFEGRRGTAAVVHAVLLSLTVAFTATRAPQDPPPSKAEDPYRICHPKREFSCCTSDESPCVRTSVARATLLGIGMLAGGVAATMLFALGDRNGSGDPATFLVGGGAIAGAGALLAGGAALGAGALIGYKALTKKKDKEKKGKDTNADSTDSDEADANFDVDGKVKEMMD